MATSFNRRIVTLSRRQKWRCIWCEFLMARDPDQAFEMALKELPETASITTLSKTQRKRFARWVRATFEHVIPKADGGTQALANGLAACAWCNNFRGLEDPKTFKQRIVAMIHRGEHPRQQYRTDGYWPTRFPRKGAIGNGGEPVA